MKIDMKSRYRELITALLPNVDDEEKLHELYVNMLIMTHDKKKGGVR